MPFAYYQRLSARERAVYDRSVEVGAIRLHAPRDLHPLVADLARALEAGERTDVELRAVRLTLALCARLGVRPVPVQVLEVRPRDAAAELHGLYTVDAADRALIRVWMRTAQKRRVVAFRTFLRTLLHELCHHFDFERLGLPISYHTEGFFKRESSLFRQLVPREGD